MMQNFRIIHSSALLAALSVVSPDLQAQGSAIDEASQQQIKNATATYEQGLQAMEAEKYGEALDLFRQSYAMVNSPNSQMMVGRALVKLGRLTEAHAELKRALQRARELAATQKKYEKTVTSAQRDLEELAGKLSFVMVPGGATARIQGKSVGPFKEDEAVPVLPGTVTIEMTYADGTTQTKELSLSPGEKTNLPTQASTGSVSPASKTNDSMSARSEEVPHRSDLGLSRKTLGYIVGGVGVLGVATFVTVGVLGASVYGDPKGDCSDNGCSSADLTNYGRKSMMQGIGYAGLGVGVAGLGIGAWLVFGGSSKTEPTTAIRVGPGSFHMNYRF